MDIAYEKRLLARLVEIPTVSGDGKAYLAMQKLLVNELGKLGARVSVVDPKENSNATDRRPNIIADFDFGSKQAICINCHYDVVPAGEGWKSNPFKLMEQGERLVGRGAADDKGAIALAAGVLKAMREGGKSAYNVKLLITCDEEIGSRNGAEYVIKKGKADGVKLAIVLDAENSPVIGCSGGVSGRIRMFGKQAHAGAEWTGRNAISLALKLLTELEAFKRIRAKKVSVLDMSEADAPKKKVFGRFNITMLKSGEKSNIIPSLCEATFDMRLIPEEDPKAAMKDLRVLVAKISKKLGIKTELKFDLVMRGFISDRKNKLVKSFISACGEKNGYGTWGVVDGRLFAERGMPVVAYGPSGSNTDHAANEFILESELKAAKSVLLRFLLG